MEYGELKRLIRNNASRDLAERKVWYSAAASAYDRSRPRYPEALIERVVAIAHLTSNSNILEVGCGPGTATISFAQLGCSMRCLEPNPNFYQLARQNCSPYPQVEIENIAFEEWMLELNQFDAVLAASSFHWIPAEIGYPKAAEALKKDGYLILLWNKELQPNYEVYQALSEVYQRYDPSLDRYETSETQRKILQGLGQMAIDSGQFKNFVSGEIESEITYSIDQYLTLLNTYSPYLKLDSQTKTALFTELRTKLESHGDNIQLAYVSAFHIAQPAETRSLHQS